MRVTLLLVWAHGCNNKVLCKSYFTIALLSLHASWRSWRYPKEAVLSQARIPYSDLFGEIPVSSSTLVQEHAAVKRSKALSKERGIAEKLSKDRPSASVELETGAPGSTMDRQRATQPKIVLDMF